MTSEPTEAYVWVWLAGSTAPVVAGRLDATPDIVTFTYGRTYLERPDRVPLFLPELPLRDEVLVPLDGMHVAGCIADAGPDSWGQRVVLRQLGAGAGGSGQVGLLTFLLESGSGRTGALDFQHRRDEYAERGAKASLEELLEAAERVDAGLPLSRALKDALVQGSSLGGARPKVHIDGAGNGKMIAKFERQSDTYPVVNAEGVAMDLARRAGLDVVSTEVVTCRDTDVLLVERFDRTPLPGERRMVVSALTIEQLDERWARYATYTKLAEEIRLRFTEPKATLREVFSRIAFNICVGNTDDHARNHAAFWDGAGERLTLTPAYDICPQLHSGGEVTQAMAYGENGENRSRIEPLLRAAPLYHLEPTGARQIVDHVVDVIRTQWGDAADGARLSSADRDLLWEAQILNRSIFYKD